jgi:tRNA(Ile)-lysidine synthase
MARRALGPARLQLVNAAQAALAPTDSALVVACSGGADSLALAAAAVVVAQRRSLPLSAAVVDHGLQSASAEVAAGAAARLEALGIDDVRVLSVSVGDTGGLEGAAREARYTALRAEAARTGATVLLGHTLDDQAETVLLGLTRGSGTRSLAGMATRVGPFLRPLLGQTRAVTEAVCLELGMTPWHDPHNADPAFARSRVRHRVLPVLEAELGPGVAAALARTAELARHDADLLDRLAAEARPGVLVDGGLDCAGLADLPRALRGRIIRDWLGVEGAGDIGLAHVVAVESLVVDWHGQGPIDVPGLAVRRVAGRLTVAT